MQQNPRFRIWTQIVQRFLFIKWIENVVNLKCCTTDETFFVFAGGRLLRGPDDKENLPLPSSWNCLHRGMTNDEISGNSVRDLSFDTFQIEENDLSSKCIFYIGGSSSEESPPQSPPPTYGYGYLQDTSWSSTQLGKDFGFEK